jgi:hypothetical protein
MRWLGFCLLCAVTSGLAVLSAQDQPAAPGGQPPAARHSIKDVMENAHKAGLLKKVLDGQATQEDKLALLDHYVSLTESKPPQGSEEGWAAKTNAVVVAAAKVAVGRDDGTELLNKATNCAACHREHKPPAPQ